MREAERFNWAATRGVNEEFLFENMPEDLLRDIKRHLFKFLKKVISLIHCTRSESLPMYFFFLNIKRFGAEITTCYINFVLAVTRTGDLWHNGQGPF